MIPVIEVLPGEFERAAGNPVLTSIDGEVKAPLAVLLADSWTDEERAKFGVFMAEPFEAPDGKVAVGQPRYEMQGEKVVEIFDLEDRPAPEPNPLDEIRAALAALAARVAAMEAR